MSFSVNEYIHGCLKAPLIICLFAIGILIYTLINVIKRRHTENIKRIVITLLMSVMIITPMFAYNFGHLFYGGIYLISETENDANTITGEIENITELSSFVFPHLNTGFDSGRSIGVCVTIDEQKYTFVTKGDLEIGDTVTIKYLPKSRYILDIYKTGDRDRGTI